MRILLIFFCSACLCYSQTKQQAIWQFASIGAATTTGPFATGLVAYYGLNGDAFDEVTEGSGTWHAAAVETNDVPFAAAGTAAWLAGTNNSYITTLNSTLIDEETAATISAWVKPDQVNDHCGIVYSLPGYNGLAMRSVGTEQLLYIVDTHTSLHEYASTVFGPGTNGWTHLCGTWSSNGVLRLYVHGKEVESTTGATGTIDQQDYFKIGWRDDDASRLFKGVIDEVAIWNRELSSNEVYRIYSEQLIYP